MTPQVEPVKFFALLEKVTPILATDLEAILAECDAAEASLGRECTDTIREAVRLTKEYREAFQVAGMADGTEFQVTIVRSR